MPDTPAFSTSVRDELTATGALRVVINLGNPVLVQGTAEAPTGVTVDIAHAVAAELGVEAELTTVTAARDSYAALVEGRADLGFLAIEPAREEGARFTTPYVQIEGVYAVRPGSELGSADEVDAEGTTIAARRGSAYDLYLTRTIEHATIVRGDEADEVFEAEGLDVLSGVRQPTTAYAEAHGLRVLEPAFQAIRQAVAVPRAYSDTAVVELTAFVERLKADGSIAESLERAGQVATVPPAG
ncbi:transporter substrate-binding domain-containing protein [Nocardioides zeae]|uniref:Transporter substrate-binding domain-containing protein n=1 Tax=Nocardioides imazamoxiresistens TaxID=3231893 RepID=A0ABU3Q0H5_9ACTN|nr:transporter substrate-binding domain-containing protein [Nocardioides zeae]MDT9595001.1 transporter substrate-binding domain-containing protein [Nocardioides zeae]